MDNLYHVHLRILRSIIHDLAPLGYAGARVSSPWIPNVTIHRDENRYLLFMELAGVDRSAISVQAEAYRLVISGSRQLAPIPSAKGGLRQTLALEIDEGPFRREVAFPEEVVPEEVAAEQVNGVLRVELPLRRTAWSDARP